MKIHMHHLIKPYEHAYKSAEHAYESALNVVERPVEDVLSGYGLPEPPPNNMDKNDGQS